MANERRDPVDIRRISTGRVCDFAAPLFFRKMFPLFFRSVSGVFPAFSGITVSGIIVYNRRISIGRARYMFDNTKTQKIQIIKKIDFSIP